MFSVWFLWNDITIVFDSLTRRCQSFSHFAAEVTETCKASWASSTDSCVVISAVSSANWLQVVARSVHVGGKSMVYMRNIRGPPLGFGAMGRARNLRGLVDAVW